MSSWPQALAFDSPIVRREALSRARSWTMPVALMVCLCALGAFALVAFSIAAGDSGHIVNADDMSSAAFLVVALQLGMVLLFTPALAGGAFAGEHERGTLDMLLLGEAGPFRLAWAKVVASVAPVLLFVIAGLPFVVAAFLHAGLGLRHVFLVELVTAVSAVAVASLAVLVSSLSSRAAVAVVIACALAAFLYAGTLLVAGLPPVDDATKTGTGAAAAHPFVFADPFYALDAVVSGRSPSGAHVGRLMQVLLLDTGLPSTSGPVVQPWQASLVVQAALAALCVYLAGRALGKRGA